jgi:hypothetical protein
MCELIFSSSLSVYTGSLACDAVVLNLTLPHPHLSMVKEKGKGKTSTGFASKKKRGKT